mmetsp:Transcript_105977/g.330519  ORF Transcript_105977/g.330519 Transcript_105977/m.330519 type:complete len:292 (-) Transcript_105977:74-949(-)
MPAGSAPPGGGGGRRRRRRRARGRRPGLLGGDLRSVPDDSREGVGEPRVELADAVRGVLGGGLAHHAGEDALEQGGEGDPDNLHEARGAPGLLREVCEADVGDGEAGPESHGEGGADLGSDVTDVDLVHHHGASGLASTLLCRCFNARLDLVQVRGVQRLLEDEVHVLKVDRLDDQGVAQAGGELQHVHVEQDPVRAQQVGRLEAGRVVHRQAADLDGAHGSDVDLDPQRGVVKVLDEPLDHPSKQVALAAVVLVAGPARAGLRRPLLGQGLGLLRLGELGPSRGGAAEPG